jgi:hypothetical protein
MKTVNFSARCRAFAGQGVRRNKIMVTLGEPIVRVYDNVAGYYTACHSLAPRTAARLLASAARLASAHPTAIVE